MGVVIATFLICGFIGGYAFIMLGPSAFILNWVLIGGGAISITYWKWFTFEQIVTADALHWSWSVAKRGLFGGWFLGLFMGLLAMLINLVVLKSTEHAFIDLLIFPISISLFGGIIFGLTFGQVTELATPGQGISQSLERATAIFLAVFLFMFLIGISSGWLYNLLQNNPINPLHTNLNSGWTFAAYFGVWLGVYFGGDAVIEHYMLRFLFISYGTLPIRLVAFLDYVTDLVFLRKVGGSYLFIHRSLMEHFSEMEFVYE